VHVSGDLLCARKGFERTRANSSQGHQINENFPSDTEMLAGGTVTEQERGDQAEGHQGLAGLSRLEMWVCNRPANFPERSAADAHPLRFSLYTAKDEGREPNDD